MKRFLPLIAALFATQLAHAQITITAADMPVYGDHLTYSNVSPIGTNINPGDSGANMVWNYDLISTGPGEDIYKNAFEVSPSFASSISTSAVGYKIADSIPGLSMLPISTPIPLSITDIHTFFDRFTTPRSAYVATAYAYKLGNILPVAANYTTPDVWYFFPLTYGNATDSTDFELHLSLMTFASIEMAGHRKTRVDGWGTITTPYYTTPVPCIRVRTETHEVDSIEFSGTRFGVPRDMVEYKWLVNGEHYPALWVTSTVIGGNENITIVRYRDAAPGPEPVKVADATPAIYELKAYPNPATDGMVTLEVPAEFKTFSVAVYDITSKLVTTLDNERKLNLAGYPAGQYLVRVTSGNKTGYVKITK